MRMRNASSTKSTGDTGPRSWNPSSIEPPVPRPIEPLLRDLLRRYLPLDRIADRRQVGRQLRIFCREAGQHVGEHHAERDLSHVAQMLAQPVDRIALMRADLLHRRAGCELA